MRKVIPTASHAQNTIQTLCWNPTDPTGCVLLKLEEQGKGWRMWTWNYTGASDTLSRLLVSFLFAVLFPCLELPSLWKCPGYHIAESVHFQLGRPHGLCGTLGLPSSPSPDGLCAPRFVTTETGWQIQGSALEYANFFIALGPSQDLVPPAVRKPSRTFPCRTIALIASTWFLFLAVSV